MYNKNIYSVEDLINMTNSNDSYLLPYSTEYGILNANGDGHDGGHDGESKGNILCITDPSEASIYLDDVLQVQITSSLLTNISTGQHTIRFTKPGYETYTDTVTVEKNKTVKVCAILTKIADIISESLVICTASNISSCPIISAYCPDNPVTTLDYLNILAIINSTSTITVTVRFVYKINDVTNYADVSANLLAGTNIIYAFPTNQQYPADTVITLEDVILV